MKSAITIVNWDCWHDTLLSVECCLRLERFSGYIVVVDNDSSDDSWSRFKSWKPGDVNLAVGIPSEVSSIIRVKIGFIPGISFDDEGCKFTGNDASVINVHFIRARVNNGYAAGNNLGINFALQDDYVNYFWFLNPDSFPIPTALSAMTRVLNPDKNTPQMTGSVLLEYFDPNRIQAVGGGFNQSS